MAFSQNLDQNEVVTLQYNLGSPKGGTSPRTRNLQAHPLPEPLPPSKSLQRPFASTWNWLVKSANEHKPSKEFETCFGQFSLEFFPFSNSH